MANRFTDSRKWDDPWFRKLPIKYKIFFIFLLDKCNHAGIWKVDFESAEFHIGEKILQEEAVKIMEGRIVELKEKWFIPKFINFQYQVTSISDLNIDNRVHKSVLDMLTKEGAYKPLIRGLQGCKDKDKDKDYNNKGIPPSLEDVKVYCNERKNGVDPMSFINHYTSKGWMIGKNKMVDWQAAVRTWEKNNQPIVTYV